MGFLFFKALNKLKKGILLKYTLEGVSGEIVLHCE